MLEEVDIERVMNQVRDVIRYGAINKDQPVIFLQPEDIDQDLKDLNVIWPVDPEVQVESNRPLFAPIIIFIKRAIRKALRWHIRPIVLRIHTFHALLVKIVNKLAEDLKNEQSRSGKLETDILQNELQVKKLASSIKKIKKRLAEIDEAKLNERILSTERVLRNLNRAMKDFLKQQRLLTSQEVSLREVHNLNYIGFENKFRGQEQIIKQRQSIFTKYFSGHDNVVDLGCGRGEFLEIMKQNQVNSYGIDVDEDMVDHCRQKGLKVIKSDIFEHLSQLTDESLGGIFIGQVVEHLNSSQLVELLQLCYEKLSFGSYLVIETINPLCLSVFARSFYLDISHKNPVHPEFLRFQLESLNFKKVELLYLSPFSNQERLEPLNVTDNLSHDKFVLNRNIAKLNDLLFSYQDYAAVACK